MHDLCPVRSLLSEPAGSCLLAVIRLIKLFQARSAADMEVVAKVQEGCQLY